MIGSCNGGSLFMQRQVGSAAVVCGEFGIVEDDGIL